MKRLEFWTNINIYYCLIQVKASNDAQVLCLTAIGNLKLTEKNLKETKVSYSHLYGILAVTRCTHWYNTQL